uniref:Uncharacterized protein n=1 Tax=Arundo donax TaxID=35708 RepID=A0A0A9D3M8_ARUDO
MSFPSLPCEVLSVDAIDMSGKHEVDLQTNIWKLRLDRYGHIIGTEYLSDLVEKEHGAHHHGILFVLPLKQKPNLALSCDNYHVRIFIHSMYILFLFCSM